MTILSTNTITQTAFREDMATRSGGLLTQAEAAAMLGVSLTAIDALRDDREILGLPYETRIAYPVAQFADGKVVGNLDCLLRVFGDTDPWDQLMLLTTPLEGFGPYPETVLQLLASQGDRATLRQLIALVSNWSA